MQMLRSEKMGIYCQVKEASGSVTTEGYKGWIDIMKAQYLGIINDVSTPLGLHASRVNGKPHFGDYILHKRVDSSSPFWFQAANSMKVIPTVQIDYVHTDDKVQKFLSYFMKNVLVSQYSHVNDTQGYPIELIGLHYQTIEKTVVPVDASGKSMSPITTGYDLSKASKL